MMRRDRTTGRDGMIARDRVTRRAFVLASALALAAARPVRAQRARPARLGWLTVAPHPFIAGFRQGMKELGWIEGDNLSIDYRYADGHADRLPALAAELARAPIDLVVASGSAAVAAARASIKALPIVAVTSDWADANLARPAGNATGIALLFDEIAAKWPELLVEAVPHVSRIGVFFEPSPSNRKQMEVVRGAAGALGRVTAAYRVDNVDNIGALIDQARREGATALIFVSAPIFTASAARIAELVRRAALPAMFESRVLVEQGGLMSYGPNLNELFRRLAWYAHRILAGAKPAELPIEQPTKFDLVINLKTAKALGVTIPLSLLARADEVIE